MKEFDNEIYASSVASTIQGLYSLFSHPRLINSRRGHLVLFYQVEV